MAVFMTDADLLPRARSAWPAFWHARWQQTVHTQERLRDCAPPATLRVAAANSSRLDRVCGSGWLAVGDAALSFDPLSSQGLLHALASGLCAGTTSHRYLAGEAAALGEYASQMDDVARAYARLHAAYYEREQRWPQSAFWHRRCPKPSQARG